MIVSGLPPIPPDLMGGPNARFWDEMGRRFPHVRSYSITINPAAVAANAVAEQTFTVTGLTTQDVVYVNKPSLTPNLGIAGARVSATNTLAISFINPSGGVIDPPSETYNVMAVRL